MRKTLILHANECLNNRPMVERISNKNLPLGMLIIIRTWTKTIIWITNFSHFLLQRTSTDSCSTEKTHINTDQSLETFLNDIKSSCIGEN